MGRGCGAVDRAVASKTGDSQFESLYRQQNISNVIICQLLSRKDENKEKEARNGPFKKRRQLRINNAFKTLSRKARNVDGVANEVLTTSGQKSFNA